MLEIGNTQNDTVDRDATLSFHQVRPRHAIGDTHGAASLRLSIHA